MTAPAADEQCICWSGPVVLHEGHCCFEYEGYDYRPGKPLPCGHCAHEMRPNLERKGWHICPMCGHEELPEAAAAGGMF